MATDNRRRSLMIVQCARLWALLALAGMALAQQPPPQKGPLNPPALPGNYPTGSFGPALPLPPQPAFPTPNTNTWTALGPAPLNEGGAASGRITGVAVDPTNSNTIYIAAAGGGVWRTTDGGATYNPLTDTQATLAIGSIAIAPTNHNHIYAGTGEANNAADSNFGLGILVSTNGGATWTLSTGPGGVFNRLAIGKISVHPTNEQIAYASVNDQVENGLLGNTGIYKTSDGGATWTNVTSAVGLDSSRPWSDVVVDPNTPTIIYAAHGDLFADSANGVYRSINSGTTWSLLTNVPSGSAIGRIALAVAPSASTSLQHALYVAEATANNQFGQSVLSEMLVSNNADAVTPTFTNLTNTPNFGGSGGQAWYDWVIAVDPSNANNVYAAGALNYNNNTLHVIRTTDGGANWIDITTAGGVEPHTDSHAMAFDSSNRLLLGNDGGIWRFDPSGAGSWTNLNGNLNTIQFTGIDLHPTSTQTVIGGSQDNGTELTTGSANWNHTDGGDGGFVQISKTAPSVMYHTFTGPTFRVSTDGGNSWTSQDPPFNNAALFNFYSPIFADSSNGNRVFMGGDALYESTNAGVNWTAHTSPSANAIDAIAVSPGGNTIYIATGGTFASSSQTWLSINDGTSWTQHSLPVSGRVNELDIDPNDGTGNTAIAVINTFDGSNGQIFRTTDGGVTWSNITGNAPQIPTWSAKIDTDACRTLYVSNETGVYSARSPYTTWAPVGTGLPHAQGVQLQLNLSLHELGLATHGRGAWYTATPTPPTLTVASVTPNSGGGVGPQVFNAKYSDSNGATDLQAVYLDIGSVGFAAHDCIAVYLPGSNQLLLFKDDNSGAFGPITLGAGGSLSNSQCTLFGGNTQATFSGNDLTVPFDIQFLPGYGGLKQIFLLEQSLYCNAPQNNGGVPQDLGTWTPTPSTPGVVSVSPSSGSGTGPTVFTATFSDNGGANDLQAVYVQFASVGEAPHNCKVAYVPGPNRLYLFTDDGASALGPIAEGAGGGSLSNSQCKLTSGNTPATPSGNNLTVPLTIQFLSGYGGKKTIFGLSQNYAGTQSNGGVLSTLGSWTSATSTPSVVSVTPNTGTGLSQTFTAVFSDTGGANDLQVAYLTFGSVLNGANSCALGWLPGGTGANGPGQLFLFNDAGNSILTVASGSGAQSVTNSQCTLSGGSTPASLTGAGNPANLNVPFTVTFKPGYAGSKNILGFAQTFGGTATTVTNLGSWNP
jgi:hypothetical protein